MAEGVVECLLEADLSALLVHWMLLLAPGKAATQEIDGVLHILWYAQVVQAMLLATPLSDSETVPEVPEDGSDAMVQEDGPTSGEGGRDARDARLRLSLLQAHVLTVGLGQDTPPTRVPQLLEKVLVLSLPFLRRAALLRTIMLGAPLPSDAASGGGIREATELVHHLRIPGVGGIPSVEGAAGALFTTWCKHLRASSSVPQLTVGAVNDIYTNFNLGNRHNSVLQVLELKNIRPSSGLLGEPKDRFRVVISDGVNSCQALLSSQHNHLVVDNMLEQHSIIEVSECLCNVVKDCRVVILLTLKVVASHRALIGNPSPIDTLWETTSPNPEAGASSPEAGPSLVPEVDKGVVQEGVQDAGPAEKWGRAHVALCARLWRQQAGPKVPRLISLPPQYHDLLKAATERKCEHCHTLPSEPTLCLLCGALLCAGNDCCRDADGTGECSLHAGSCGGGSAALLLVKQCVVLILAHGRGCRHSIPYLDVYGEEDTGLRRGRPLHLSAEREARLLKLWASHGLHTELARATTDNSAVDWSTL